MSNLTIEDLKLASAIRDVMHNFPDATTVVTRDGTNMDSINRVIDYFKTLGWSGEYMDEESDIADESGSGYLKFNKI